MSNDQNHDHQTEDMYAQEDDNQHHQDQLHDQALDKKVLPKTGSPEALGVTWTEGTYSGKNLRGLCVLAWLITVVFIGLGIYLMFKGSMGNRGGLIWSILMFFPICAWGYFICVYFYRTTTLRYRLTSHRFYNEHGLFKKTIDTLELINIEDMQMVQTLVDRLINGGTGSITIISSDKTTPTLKIMGLENPRDAYESIDEMRRRERNARVIRSVE